MGVANYNITSKCRVFCGGLGGFYYFMFITLLHILQCPHLQGEGGGGGGGVTLNNAHHNILITCSVKNVQVITNHVVGKVADEANTSCSI